MKIVFFLFFGLATAISIFIGRETEITTEKTILLGRLKISVIAKETPGKHGIVVMNQLENKWKLKWTDCTDEIRSQVKFL